MGIRRWIARGYVQDLGDESERMDRPGADLADCHCRCASVLIGQVRGRAGVRQMPVGRRLFAASALMLFLELALIRWLGANLVHLSYFSNFVLLGSFLGVGLGFMRSAAAATARRPPPVYSALTLVALIGFVSAYPVTINRDSSQLIFFTSVTTSGPPMWVTLPVVFLAVAAVMAGSGELAMVFPVLHRALAPAARLVFRSLQAMFTQFAAT